MRVPRCRQLQPNDVTHSIWRGHNGEWIFRGCDNKQVYLKILAEEVKESDVSVNSFCIMNNHEHTVSFNETVTGYSRFFQKVHGRYARRYNDNNDRCGAVGVDRPKSLVVRDERHLMNATFYADANPVRAGIVKHPRKYKWSSYCYYAHGDTTYRSLITEPKWYKELGRTAEVRQAAYRRLFDAYLRREGLAPKPGMANGYYIGDVDWILGRMRLQDAPLRGSDGVDAETKGSQVGRCDTS
jgi:putative transposase